MIEKSMLFIQQYLNSKLQQSFGIKDDIIILGNITPIENSSSNGHENKLVLSVLNIQHEAQKPFAPYIRQAGQIADPNADKLISLNIYLLISANYTPQHYNTGLSMLSKVMAIVDSHPSFSPEAFPGIDASIHKILLEIYNAPLLEMTNIWTSMGGNSMPSIIYKARVMGVFQEDKQPVDPIKIND